MRSLIFSLILLISCSCRTAAPAAPADSDPKEPGFWEVCYDVDGTVVDYDGECADAKQIDWGKLPVRLYVDPTYPDRNAVLKAVRVWNAWLGTDVFFVTSNPVGTDIDVVYKVGTFVDPAGYSLHRMDFERKRPHFTVTMFGDYSHSVVIICHELGHAMGLAHDPGRVRSIMHPSGEWYLPWLTAKDCRALRAKYGLAPGHC